MKSGQSPDSNSNGTPHSTRAIINLNAFRSNLDVVRHIIGDRVKIMAVLKSNAYGHGVMEIAKAAVGWGVEYLAVARYTEGLELRKAGVTKPILVCEIVAQEHVGDCLAEGLELTVTTSEGAETIARIAEAAGKEAKVHVKVDTGMGRLGFAYQDAPEAIERIAHTRQLALTGVFSHFATSEQADDAFAREQIGRFVGVLEATKQRGVSIPLRHMANSGAILNFPQSHFDMVRPGLVLYGHTPAKQMPAASRLVPVMSLVSRVSHMKTVEPDTSISYSRKFFTKRRTHIATIPIGYGDGYSRRLTNNAEVLIRGKRYPVVGTVCMDHIMVDTGTNDTVKVNDEVVLIGEQAGDRITCWEVAERMGTIPYEVTCLIAPRVSRVFVNGTG